MQTLVKGRPVRDANRLAKQGLTEEQIAAHMGTNIDASRGGCAAAAKRRKGGKWGRTEKAAEAGQQGRRQEARGKT